MMVPTGGWICMNTFGVLLDPGSNEGAVASKIAAIRDSAAVASIAVRNPPSVYGGAVKFPDGSCWAMSGLPEIADHILITLVVSYVYGYQDHSRTHRLLSFALPGVMDAATEKGMTESSYNRLVHHFETMVHRAMR